ncbi:MAG: LytTR family DNA-binding domain-containing protein [Leadbetterella sp.]|nr:LytTR family DNA-binding domain-containing protein [Leadbetterella sp.]
MHIEAIAIDDEPKALEVVTILAEKVPFLNVKATFTDAFKAIPYLQQNKVDLIFLDIKMPDISGFDFLSTLSRRPKIIFTTAYSEYAVNAFEVDAVDYLMKPFSLTRFSKACNKVLDALEPETLQTESTFLKTGPEEEKIFFEDILFIISQGNYMEYHLKDRKLLCRQTIQEAMQQLPAEKFIRLHRSYIVATDKIDKVSRTAVWVQKTEIPVGASYEDAYQLIRDKLLKK